VIQDGQAAVASGSGFTPNGHVRSHLVRPDGSEYPEMQLTADARGEVSHTINIILTEIGTYELQWIDLSSKAEVSSRFMVAERVPVASAPPAASPLERTPETYVGVWQGRVSGASGPEAQLVLVALSGGAAGGVVGTVAYPGFSCGGELWLLGGSGDSVQLGEHITYGEERCTGHGIIAVRRSQDGGLEFQRREAGHLDAPPAAGKLAKRL
jgi:hypothetical protein